MLDLCSFARKNFDRKGLKRIHSQMYLKKRNAPCASVGFPSISNYQNVPLRVFTDEVVYCNGVKCEDYETCQYNRNTRGYKCARVYG